MESPFAAIERGLIFQRSGRLREAESAYREALKANPENADALHLLGTIAFQAGKHEPAVALIQRAIRINPNNANYYSNCGPALRNLNRYEEAIACYHSAIALAPDHPQAWYNLGKTYFDFRKPAEALEAYTRQLEINPDHASSRWNRSLANLLLGNLSEGWREYEFRWTATAASTSKRIFAAPQWSGEPIVGKTLFIHAEQGLGDTIQFCRYALLAADRGAHVIVECQPELLDLLRSISHISTLIRPGEPLPEFDFQIPMMSLPMAFETSLENIPSSAPYLHSDPARILNWKSRLEKLGSPQNIGLVWAGGEKHPSNEKRSMRLSQFALLAELAGISWISLQKGSPSEQLAQAPFPVLDWTSELHDFADTAALIQSLDGVVTVDTAVAHLAGALGKPVWILIPFLPDFRWLLDRNDSPWYPTARLIRQPALGDWAGSIQRLFSTLDIFLKAL